MASIRGRFARLGVCYTCRHGVLQSTMSTHLARKAWLRTLYKGGGARQEDHRFPSHLPNLDIRPLSSKREGLCSNLRGGRLMWAKLVGLIQSIVSTEFY